MITSNQKNNENHTIISENEEEGKCSTIKKSYNKVKSKKLYQSLDSDYDVEDEKVKDATPALNIVSKVNKQQLSKRGSIKIHKGLKKNVQLNNSK